MKPESKKQLIVRITIAITVITLIALLIYILFELLGINGISQEEIQTFIESTGAIAPLTFILITFAQVTLIPIPGAITILAGNYLFGALEAFIYSYIGVLLGSMVAFFLGRLIGRRFVNWMAGGKENADKWIDRLKGREKVAMFFMFLLPMFPDDLLCAIAGMLKYSTLEFFILQLITRATSIFGTLFFMSGEIIPYNAWGISLIAFLVLAAIIGFALVMKHYEKIREKLDRIFNRNNKK